ncbi:MAG: hypothetical protein OXT65_06750 [Alphaproteobacteria bacterium]|nr:hypothetical protein [Alphaproteobacteria bacterium]
MSKASVLLIFAFLAMVFAWLTFSATNGYGYMGYYGYYRPSSMFHWGSARTYPGDPSNRADSRNGNTHMRSGFHGGK